MIQSTNERVNLSIEEDDLDLTLVQGEALTGGLDPANSFDSFGPKRPARALLNLVSDLPMELMEEIETKSWLLKLFSKVPMFMLLCSTGVLSGMNYAAFRFVGLALRDGHALFSTFVLGLSVIGLVGSGIQFALLNLTLKNYKQIDVVPVY
jgi:hypothetical protein